MDDGLWTEVDFEVTEVDFSGQSEDYILYFSRGRWQAELAAINGCDISGLL